MQENTQEGSQSMSDEMKWGEEPQEPGNTSSQQIQSEEVQESAAPAQKVAPTEKSTDAENNSSESENVTYHYKYTRGTARTTSDGCPASHPYSASRMNQSSQESQTPPRYAHYQVNQEQNQYGNGGEPPKKQRHTSHGSGYFSKKVGPVIALAVVFGLVAGVVFQGVNVLSRKYLGTGQYTPIGTTETVPDAAQEANSVSVSDAVNQAGTVAGVAQAAMPSVVAITSISMQEIQSFFGYGMEYPSTGSGSGIIVGENDDELLIATNNHVVEGATTLNVCFIGSDVVNVEQETQNYVNGEGDLDIEGAVSAKVKGTDTDNDLAVISVKKSDIPEDTMNEIKIAQLGNSDDLMVGEQVVAIGNALGYGQTVTSGWVSALNRTVTTSDGTSSELIQTDAAINPGNSGGALLNMRGELIGINCAKIASSSVEGTGYAIPISKAQPILEELMNRKTRDKVEDATKAAYLGVKPADLSTEAIQMYNMPSGAFVVEVISGEAADKAGIQKNDIITKLDGQKVSGKKDLNDKLQYYTAGEEIEVVIARADNGEYKEHTLTVTLGARPASDN